MTDRALTDPDTFTRSSIGYIRRGRWVLAAMYGKLTGYKPRCDLGERTLALMPAAIWTAMLLPMEAICWKMTVP